MGWNEGLLNNSSWASSCLRRWGSNICCDSSQLESQIISIGSNPPLSDGEKTCVSRFQVSSCGGWLSSCFTWFFSDFFYTPTKKICNIPQTQVPSWVFLPSLRFYIQTICFTSRIAPPEAPNPSLVSRWLPWMGSHKHCGGRLGWPASQGELSRGEGSCPSGDEWDP